MASRRRFALTVVAGLVALALLAWSAPARAGCGIWGTNTVKYAPATLWDCSNRFFLNVQTDGNLVVYDAAQSNKVLWASGTNGSHASARLAVQGDGNLVLYDTYAGKQRAYWWSGTNSSANANPYLAMQTDGNLVMYRPSNYPFWATNVYYTKEGVLTYAGQESQCRGRCGAGCNGWMPFGGGIYTSACAAHDDCVTAHGHLYPTCLTLFVPAAVSYLVTAAKNLVKKVWTSITHIFGW